MTLLLECIFQHLKFSGKDEFLGLPMTVFEKHPLNFSIGHRHHGNQMRTGFSGLYPHSLEDYDEELSNICFETHLSNHTKWDHAESEYDDIRKDMASVHLVTAHYSVPNDCPPLDLQAIFAKRARVTGGYAISDDESEASDESDNDWTMED